MLWAEVAWFAQLPALHSLEIHFSLGEMEIEGLQAKQI